MPKSVPIAARRSDSTLAQERAIQACATGKVDLRNQVTHTMDAIRLTELGARPGLVRQLTGLDSGRLKRLYQQIHGDPAPARQYPFTDAWFQRSERRMLHAAIVWRLHVELSKSLRRAARLLIDVYECYCQFVNSPLLHIGRVSLVPRFVAMSLWVQRACGACNASYVGPSDVVEVMCPACRVYHRVCHPQKCYADSAVHTARRSPLGRERVQRGGQADDAQ